MAELHPFRGIRYHMGNVPNLSGVLCPPRHALSEQERFRYYLRHPHNAVRLDYGQDDPDDDAVINRHSRAAETMTRWLSEGILRRDEIPGFYIYEQEFIAPDGDDTENRLGLLALVRLEDIETGNVRVMDAPRPDLTLDRLALLKATHVEMAPIVALYEDPDQLAAEILLEEKAMPPFLSLTDEEGEQHRLWRLIDPGLIERVQEALATSPLYLADDLYRYEAALAYRDHLNANGADAANGLHNYAMMLLVDTEDPGLRLSAVHRLVKAPQVPADFLERLSPHYDIQPHALSDDRPDPEQLSALHDGASRLGMLRTSERTYYALSPKEDGLEAEQLHDRVLSGVLGLSPADGAVSYAREVREVLVGMGSGEFDLAFLLPPPRLEAAPRATAPARTAEILPKAPTGLVFHHLEGTI
ncbi:MAG TPA: DUF1015 domain-containing protein [Pantanalinema sp.]